MPRWDFWSQMKIQEKWRWLKESGCYPRRQPVSEGTEDLGAPKKEDESGEVPEMKEGTTYRHIDVVDMSKEPKLILAEWNKIKACDRPFPKELWGNHARKAELCNAYLIGERRRMRES